MSNSLHPMDPLSTGFPRQEYWSGLPFPSLGDLPDPGTKHVAPSWQVDSLPVSHMGAQCSLRGWVLLPGASPAGHCDQREIPAYIQQQGGSKHFEMLSEDSIFLKKAWPGERICKRIDTCIWITESLCCTPEMNTILLINYASNIYILRPELKSTCFVIDQPKCFTRT